MTRTPTASSDATSPVDDAETPGAAPATPVAGSPSGAPDTVDDPQGGHQADAPPRHLAEVAPATAEDVEHDVERGVEQDVEQDLGTSEDPQTSPPAAPAAHSRRARRRRWILPTVLAVLLAAAIGSGVYLWYVAEAWIERDAQWQAHAEELGAELGTTQAELADTMAELEVVRGQLGQAQGRISELADEKARLGDEHAVIRQLADYQERVSQVAATVVSGLDACIATQQQLVRWYADTAAAEEAGEEDPELLPPDPAQLDSLSAAVTEVCEAAQTAKDALQEELDG